MEVKIFQKALPKDSLYVRTEVFVKEQGFVDEFDKTDETCIHLIGYEGNNPVAVCRCFYEQDPKVWHIGRVAVLKSHRGKGLGSAIMAAAEDAIKARGGAKAELSSQCRAMHFYETLGYVADGEAYLDEGCPHILMTKSLL